MKAPEVSCVCNEAMVKSSGGWEFKNIPQPCTKCLKRQMAEESTERSDTKKQDDKEEDPPSYFDLFKTA